MNHLGMLKCRFQLKKCEMSLAFYIYKLPRDAMLLRSKALELVDIWVCYTFWII